MLGRRRMPRGGRALALILAPVLLASCASIFKGTSSTLRVVSEPPGADVYAGGQLVARTPGEVTVITSYWPHGYNLSFHLPGYQPQAVVVNPSVGGGWVTLDVLVGLFTLFIPLVVDGTTGAWNSFPPEVSVVLERPTPTSQIERVALLIAERHLLPVPELELLRRALAALEADAGLPATLPPATVPDALSAIAAAVARGEQRQPPVSASHLVDLAAGAMAASLGDQSRYFPPDAFRPEWRSAVTGSSTGMGMAGRWPDGPRGPSSSVECRLLDGRILYLGVATLAGGEAKAIRAASEALGGAAGMVILDLRGNPGGRLEQSIAVSDLFLAGGEITRVDGRVEPGQPIMATAGTSWLKRARIVVLVDSGTAGGAEVIVAALQDNQRAAVFGEKTAGSGDVRVLYRLDSGAGLSLVIATLIRPDGVPIGPAGITPDRPPVLPALPPATLHEEADCPGWPALYRVTRDPAVAAAAALLLTTP